MTDYIEPRIGTVGFDGPAGRTYAKLGLVEYQESFRGAPASKLLRRHRRQAGEDFFFVARASAAITHAADPLLRNVTLPYLPEGCVPEQPFDTGEAGRAAWTWTCERATALGAQAIFLQTPMGFRPTAENRQRLAAFAEQVIGGDRATKVIWDSQGLWSLEELRALCEDLGLVPSYDPLLEEDRIAGSAYLRVLGRARGEHGLSADELDFVADAAAEMETPWVALHTASPFRDARLLHKLLTGLG